MEDPQDLLKVADVLNEHIIVEGKKLDVFSPSCLVSFPEFNLEESRNDRVEKGLNKKREEVKEDLKKLIGNNDAMNALLNHNVHKNEQGSVEEKKLDVFSPSCLVSLPASDREESFKKGIQIVTVKGMEKIVQKKLDVYSPSIPLSLAASKPEDIKHIGTEKEQRKIQEQKLDVCFPSFLVSLPASNEEDSENDQVVNSGRVVKRLADGVQPKNKKLEKEGKKN